MASEPPTTIKAREKRHLERAAFRAVYEAYCRALSTGPLSAMDYSRVGNAGPKFCNNGGKTNSIDFIADVEKAMHDALSKWESAYVLKAYAQSAHKQVGTEYSASLEAKLGRIFLARKLYPIAEYFRYIKR